VALGTIGAIGGGGLGWVTAGVEGLVIGVLLGAVAAALAAWAVQGQERESADRNSQLDAEIGVDGGDIGAPNLEHIPSRSHQPSRESSGVGGPAGSSPASGPFLKPPS
jgi:hypothetical protein